MMMFNEVAKVINELIDSLDDAVGDALVNRLRDSGDVGSDLADAIIADVSQGPREGVVVHDAYADFDETAIRHASGHHLKKAMLGLRSSQPAGHLLNELTNSVDAAAEASDEPYRHVLLALIAARRERIGEDPHGRETPERAAYMDSLDTVAKTICLYL